MKEQIYNIITKNVNATPVGKGNSVIGIIPASEEITDHVFQFIEWIQEENWSKYKKLDWWVKKDNKIPPKNPPLTLNELYNFWYSNVFSKTKKG
jgi:hypothetical protein